MELSPERDEKGPDDIHRGSRPSANQNDRTRATMGVGATMNDTNMPFSPPTIKRNDYSPDE